MRLPMAEPTQYRAMEPSAPPKAMSRYFCKASPPDGSHVAAKSSRLRNGSGYPFLKCMQGLRRDMTPRQDSLSGVIICRAYGAGQRFRVNSITTNNTFITRWDAGECQPGSVVNSSRGAMKLNLFSGVAGEDLFEEAGQHELETAAILIPVHGS